MSKIEKIGYRLVPTPFYCYSEVKTDELFIISGESKLSIASEDGQSGDKKEPSSVIKKPVVVKFSSPRKEGEEVRFALTKETSETTKLRRASE